MRRGQGQSQLERRAVFKTSLCCMLMVASSCWADPPGPLYSEEKVVDEWLRGQQFRAQKHISPDRVVWESDMLSADVDVTQYVVDRRPNRPQVFEKRDVPGPLGFRIEIQKTKHLPQILSQFITTRGQERQRFTHRDRQGTLLSTVLWFSHPAEAPLTLVYSIEYGPKRRDSQFYLLDDELKALRAHR